MNYGAAIIPQWIFTCRLDTVRHSFGFEWLAASDAALLVMVLVGFWSLMDIRDQVALFFHKNNNQMLDK